MSAGRKFFGLSRNVFVFGFVSLLNDWSSEITVRILPLFLANVLGVKTSIIGLIEGLADSTATFLKMFSGWLSDRLRARKWLAVAGYGLSALTKPFFYFASTWEVVAVVRWADRVGKGIRTAPRDALLAAWAEPSTRGYVFGLHRSMDHAGAVVGPLLASLFLWGFPEHYRTLFALTLIPGVIAVLMLLPVPETADRPPASVAQDFSPASDGVRNSPLAQGGSVRSSVVAPNVPSYVAQDFSPAIDSVRTSPLAQDFSSAIGSQFYRYLGVVLLFSLGNSTDAFLLLRLGDVGVGAAWIPIAWAALHVVKAGVSPIGGHLSDRLSRRGIIVTGWLVYAAVYAGFAVATSKPALLTLFLAYGIYYGLTEGVEKAVVADLAPAEARGTAFGAYHAVIGIGALAASLLFGLIWKVAGAPAAFGVGAALALLSAALLTGLSLNRPSMTS